MAKGMPKGVPSIVIINVIPRIINAIPNIPANTRPTRLSIRANKSQTNAKGHKNHGDFCLVVIFLPSIKILYLYCGNKLFQVDSLTGAQYFYIARGRFGKFFGIFSTTHNIAPVVRYRHFGIDMFGCLGGLRGVHSVCTADR